MMNKDSELLIVTGEVSGDLFYFGLALSHISIKGHGETHEKKRTGGELL